MVKSDGSFAHTCFKSMEIPEALKSKSKEEFIREFKEIVLGKQVMNKE